MKKKNKNKKVKKGFSKSIMNGVDFHHHTTKINQRSKQNVRKMDKNQRLNNIIRITM